SSWRGHRRQKFRVRLALLQAAEQKLHRFDGREWAQHFSQNPNAAQFIGREKQFVLTRTGALNIDCGEDTLIGQSAVKIDFHVAGAFELFEDDTFHAAAGVDKRRRDDCERAAFFDVSSRRKEATRALQSVGVNTARKNLAGWWGNRVVGASKTRDRV